MDEFRNELKKHEDYIGKKYFLKQKYISKLIKNMYLDMVIILSFFVIFNILFSKSSSYKSIRITLVGLFALIGVLNTILCTKSISKHKAIYYQVTNNALIHFNGKKNYIYPWSDFKSIVKDANKLDMLYPIVFKTSNKLLVLNKNIDKNYNLIADIIKNTKDIAEIDFKVLEEFKN
ncbi:hypothetical protein J2Z76_001730 [Sedimentibacter acidaminivorans]|uniref:YcxB-like protein domain-containing protein n=1 Tax=Sedimentibacter acidaminivorans TaxID=913099 RepID=A0ABS4GDZ5_9FIRM|nr:hypothetical protein [Sedimentibacter acidaminivorans]MBP1925869.1 hypothetical protein [Sedimentibacter acidaminivorans]